MSKICPKCNSELNDDVNFCVKCGANLNEPTPVQPTVAPPANPEIPVSQATPVGATVAKPKSKVLAGVFGIIFGGLGVHNFYLGYTGKAVAQLLITFLTCGVGSVISGIWGLIEGIMILTGSIDKDAKGNPLEG